MCEANYTRDLIKLRNNFCKYIEISYIISINKLTYKHRVLTIESSEQAK